MGKQKSKKHERRARREREELERQAALEEMAKRRRVLAIASIALPIATLGGSLAIYYGTGDRQLAALLGLVGIALWVPALLGLIGSAVKPRDRTRAGSIDFGSKR